MLDMNDPKLLKAFEEYIKGVDDRRHAARDKAFPDHKGHTCEEHEVEYFDAMMQSVIVDCSCGQRLTIDRDFFQ